MWVDFDQAKDKLNLAKHGLSMGIARSLVWDEALVWIDERFEYDELRMVGLVPEGNMLYYGAFVDRADVRRVISLRYAHTGRTNTMLKTTPKRQINVPSVQENARILAAARADPDAQPLTRKQLAAMVPLKSILGRPKSDNKKVLVSVRYSPAVIEYFRSTGEGWQARMDGVLTEYVSQQARPCDGKSGES